MANNVASSLQRGPAQPTYQVDVGSAQYACGIVATAGNNQLVASPGPGRRIVVLAFVMQNEAATANIMVLRSANDNRWRCWGQNQGDGLALVFPPGNEWKLDQNESLNMWLNAATQCGYSVKYRIEVA